MAKNFPSGSKNDWIPWIIKATAKTDRTYVIVKSQRYKSPWLTLVKCNK